MGAFRPCAGWPGLPGPCALYRNSCPKLGRIKFLNSPQKNVYDALGRQTSDIVAALGAGVDGSVMRIDNLTYSPTTGQTFVYNAWNELVSVSAGGNVIASYQYDALARRDVQTENGTTTAIYFDGSNAIEERVNGTPTTQYVWNPLATNTLVEVNSYTVCSCRQICPRHGHSSVIGPWAGRNSNSRGSADGNGGLANWTARSSLDGKVGELPKRAAVFEQQPAATTLCHNFPGRTRAKE